MHSHLGVVESKWTHGGCVLVLLATCSYCNTQARTVAWSPGAPPGHAHHMERARPWSSALVSFVRSDTRGALGLGRAGLASNLHARCADGFEQRDSFTCDSSCSGTTSARPPCAPGALWPRLIWPCLGRLDPGRRSAGDGLRAVWRPASPKGGGEG